MFDDKIITGRYKGHKIHFDGMFYYIKVDGKIYVVDMDRIR